MATSTILLVVLAAIVALGVVLLQYYFKSKRRGKLNILLSFLRFVGLLGLFLLLINPKFTKNEYTLEKANLIILADNSASMLESAEEIASVISKMESAKSISERFNLRKYSFGSNLQEENGLTFDAKNTNISKALTALNEVYGSSKSAVLLLTDGNQTVGADYEFQAAQLQSTVYPIGIGDTTQYEDIAVGNVNSNRYAFLKNKYPIEIEVFYSGEEAVTTTLTVRENGNLKYRENVKLSKTDNTKTIQTLLSANTVGVKSISIELDGLENEQNTNNNQKRVAVEVIDEKTNIALVSDIKHPDIGALKKAIESNEQRSVRILRSSVDLKTLDEVDLFILYQPSSGFSPLYEYIKQKKASVFTIGGTNTSWNVINKALRKYNVEDGYPIQEVFGVLNPSFTKFDITDFSLEDFPPLHSDAGPIVVPTEGETVLQMKIQGKTMSSPLLYTLEIDGYREIVLFGENIWKWRIQSFRNQQNFENFDEFMSKLILYLSTNNTKNRLNIDYQSIYEGTNDAKIRASYFDEAFVFDANASLTVYLTNEEDNTKKEIPMLLKGTFYEADLSDLPPARYGFQVTVKDEKRSKSGNFTILDFEVEQQFFSTDHKKLDQLATATNGKLFYPDQIDALINELTADSQYVPTQKATKNVVSLIDFRMLLAVIVAALAAEWFIRKYNGLT